MPLCRRHTGYYLETLLVVTAQGRGVLWYLVGRGQGCCSTPHIAQNSLPNANGVKVVKS